jgi:hypothetical protein
MVSACPICFVLGISLGDDRSRSRIRGGLQRLAQPAKQGLHLLLVQHGRFHQQRAWPGRDQTQITFDGDLDRILNESDAARVSDLTVLWWGIHSHAGSLPAAVSNDRVRRLFTQTLP